MPKEFAALHLATIPTAETRDTHKPAQSLPGQPHRNNRNLSSMKKKRQFSAILLGAALACAPAFGSGQQSSGSSSSGAPSSVVSTGTAKPRPSGDAKPTSGPKQSMRTAGSDTKNAAKNATQGAKQGTQKAYNTTKSGTKKVASKTTNTTKGAVNGAKSGAKQPTTTPPTS